MARRRPRRFGGNGRTADAVAAQAAVAERGARTLAGIRGPLEKGRKQVPDQVARRLCAAARVRASEQAVPRELHASRRCGRWGRTSDIDVRAQPLRGRAADAAGDDEAENGADRRGEPARRPRSLLQRGAQRRAVRGAEGSGRTPVRGADDAHGRGRADAARFLHAGREKAERGECEGPRQGVDDGLPASVAEAEERGKANRLSRRLDRVLYFAPIKSGSSSSIATFRERGGRLGFVSTTCGLTDARSSSGFRYWPVKLAFVSATVSGVPSTTIRPPFTPPPGPRSITQSAVLMTSRLCSITTTVLPVSTRRWRTSNSFLTSSKCKPVVGSSRM